MRWYEIQFKMLAWTKGLISVSVVTPSTSRARGRWSEPESQWIVGVGVRQRRGSSVSWQLRYWQHSTEDWGLSLSWWRYELIDEMIVMTVTSPALLLWILQGEQYYQLSSHYNSECNRRLDICLLYPPHTNRPPVPRHPRGGRGAGVWVWHGGGQTVQCQVVPQW